MAQNIEAPILLETIRSINRTFTPAQRKADIEEAVAEYGNLRDAARALSQEGNIGRTHWVVGAVLKESGETIADALQNDPALRVWAAMTLYTAFTIRGWYSIEDLLDARARGELDTADGPERIARRLATAEQCFNTAAAIRRETPFEDPQK